MRRLVRSLPRDHYDTLKFLFELLSRVEKLSAVNKMAVHNLATVFGPNLLRLPGAQENMLQLVEDTPIVNGLVNTLLKEYDTIFAENEDDKLLEARALFAYTSQGPNQVDLAQNQVVSVLSGEGKDGWMWIDDHKGHTGVVPASYLKTIDINEGKRLKFMEEMELVRTRCCESDASVTWGGGADILHRCEVNSMRNNTNSSNSPTFTVNWRT